ncbi:MAG: hypothetical protein HGN29_00025 [Asgard group archaeon]|nr:hypothetical protein [Asgard group archaeon]
MLVQYCLKKLIIKKKKGSPILEEILLIGIVILIFAIIFGLIFSLVDWSSTKQGEFFNW